MEGISSDASLDSLVWGIGLSLAAVHIETVADTNLEAAVARALADSPRRVVFAEWQGKKYVVKRIARKSKRKGRFKLSLIEAFSRWAFPGHVVKGSLKAGDGRWELARNKALAAAGERVPHVVLSLPEAVVYEYCGTVLSLYLDTLSQTEKQTLIRQAMLDLARFHHAGHWHGAAQFRNMVAMASDASGMPVFCRFDFEEDLAEQFSLPLLQMYDLGLFLADVLYLDGEMAHMTAWAGSLLRDYRAVHWSGEHAYLLARLARMVRPILWVGPLIRRFGNWESRRTLALAKVLTLAAREDAAQAMESAP